MHVCVACPLVGAVRVSKVWVDAFIAQQLVLGKLFVVVKRDPVCTKLFEHLKDSRHRTMRLFAGQRFERRVQAFAVNQGEQYA